MIILITILSTIIGTMYLIQVMAVIFIWNDNNHRNYYHTTTTPTRDLNPVRFFIVLEELA